MSYANQLRITINKPDYKNLKDREERVILQIGQAEWKQAYQNLSKKAFGLYLILAENACGYKYDLSMAYTTAKLGIGRTSYYDAVQELKEKGYLVQKISGTVLFDFYTVPIEKKNKSVNADNRP